MRLSGRRSSRAEDRFESWITQQHQRRVLVGETTPSGPCPDEEFLRDLARKSKSIALSDPRIDHAATCPKCMSQLIELRKENRLRLKAGMAEKPDYGIDAPGVVRNLLLSGAGFLVLALIFPRVTVAHVTLLFFPGFLYPAASFLLGGRVDAPLREGRQVPPSRPHSGQDPVDRRRVRSRHGHGPRAAADWSG